MAQFVSGGIWDYGFGLVKDFVTRQPLITSTASELQELLEVAHIYMLSSDFWHVDLYAKSRKAACQAPQRVKLSKSQRQTLLTALRP